MVKIEQMNNGDNLVVVGRGHFKKYAKYKTRPKILYLVRNYVVTKNNQEFVYSAIQLSTLIIICPKEWIGRKVKLKAELV